MKKLLLSLYQQYFNLQEESHAIQHDKANWPEGMDYKGMCARVNELTPAIRRAAQQIKHLESKIKKS